jgi:TetR/AcrR family transcriptional regulator, regulator of cefoperazone and chloramphenicol sensitivity
MRPRYSPAETKVRIISAAGEVFGEHGFHGTTIRQITKKAGVNVAAVNYHFRDKSELYLRVLREAKNCSHELAAVSLTGTPENCLRVFIVAFVGYLLDPKRPLWHVQVISQEMIHPTPALDLLMRELTEPVFRQLRGLIAAVAAAPLTNTQCDLLASSILGQCLFHVRSRPMIERLAPELGGKNPDRIDLIANHIATFSLTALSHLPGTTYQPAQS